MAHKFIANTTWLATISNPPIVRHNHIGAAASIEAIKDSPFTPDQPCIAPAAEIEVT